MRKFFEVVPYQQVGDLRFGMPRKEAQRICGERVSTCMYGFPVEDRYLDSFGFMHTLCNNRELLEGVELFPDVSVEELVLNYGQEEVVLTKDPEELVERFAKVTDDLVADEDAEGYSSKKLGLKIYCPEGFVEDIILHDRDCYKEEDEYLESEGLI